MKKLKVMDLFAGAGGMSNGLARARCQGEQVFAPILLVDHDPSAARTLKQNFPNIKYLVADIGQLDAGDLRRVAGLRYNQRPDVVVGGPPCQGFSILRKNKHLHDPRNRLFKVFLDLAGDLSPNLIIIENVKNVSHCNEGRFLDEIYVSLSKYGYYVNSAVLNAHEFGVPQLRERTFIAAFHSRTGIRDFTLPSGKYPPIRFARSLIEEDGEPSPDILTEYISVEDAIGDLPALAPGQKSSQYNGPAFSDYQHARRQGSQVLHNHEARHHSQQFLTKLSRIEPGRSNRDLSDDERLDRGRLKQYFSQAYARLHADGIAYTITTHFLNPGSGRFTHYRDLRSLTVREAARLQGFDDKFLFLGSMEDQQEHVGNAVPPLLARALGEHLGSMLL